MNVSFCGAICSEGVLLLSVGICVSMQIFLHIQVHLPTDQEMKRETGKMGESTTQWGDAGDFQYTAGCMSVCMCVFTCALTELITKVPPDLLSCFNPKIFCF